MSPSKVWLIFGAAAAVLLSGVLLGTIYKPSPSGEALRYFDPDFLALAAAYQRSATFVFVARQLLLFGALAAAASILGRHYPARLQVSLSSTAASLAGIILLLFLLTFPLDYYRGFILEHRFGLSVQSFAAWLSDYLKNFSISFLLIFLMLLGLHLLMVRLPGRWWAAAGLFFTLFLIVSTYLYPLIIDPLFYRFEVLEDQQMRAGILEMASEAGLEVEQVLVADASRRTTKVNAYFAGIGKTKRIVIYDNLLHRFSPEETLAVIAHEMGHWKYSHLVKGIFLGAAGMFLGLWLLQSLLEGMCAKGGLHALTVALLFLALFSFISLPLQNAFSRAFERQADLEAIRLTKDPLTVITLEQNLARANLAEVEPHPFVKFVLYTHPPVLERIAMARREADKICAAN